MRNLKYIFLGLFSFGLTIQANAQTTGATELSATPPIQETKVPVKPSGKEPKITVSESSFSHKPQFSLSAGTQFSSLFGTSAYVQPSFLIPVTPRFSGFASLTMVNSFGPTFTRSTTESNAINNHAFGNQQYILNVGGNYMVSERLQITGSAWKDLSRQSALPMNRVNLLFPSSSSGMAFRANYKVTENLSVSGGFRYSNGRGYNNFNNSFYPGYNTPFAF